MASDTDGPAESHREKLAKCVDGGGCTEIWEAITTLREGDTSPSDDDSADEE